MRVHVFKIRYHVLNETKDEKGVPSRSTSGELYELVAATSQQAAVAALPKPVAGVNEILHIGTEIRNALLAYTQEEAEE